jgi:hypothetical protein
MQISKLGSIVKNVSTASSVSTWLFDIHSVFVGIDV